MPFKHVSPIQSQTTSPPPISPRSTPENNDIPATFFEITTALAFLFFAKRGVDVVVLETGTFFFHFFFGNSNMGRKKYKIVEST